MERSRTVQASAARSTAAVDHNLTKNLGGPALPASRNGGLLNAQHGANRQQACQCSRWGGFSGVLGPGVSDVLGVSQMCSEVLLAWVSQMCSDPICAGSEQAQTQISLRLRKHRGGRVLSRTLVAPGLVLQAHCMRYLCCKCHTHRGYASLL